mgnify:FL=1
MGVDIKLFRKEKGGDPELVRKSEIARNRNPEQLKKVDEIVEKDEKWRKTLFQKDQLAKEFNRLNKEIGKVKKEGGDWESIVAEADKIKLEKEVLEKEEGVIFTDLQVNLKSIGNLVHESVLVDNNEDNNPVVRKWGTIPDIVVNNTPGKACHHHVLEMIGGYDPKRGQRIAGHRGFFLKGMGAMLNIALVNYGLAFLNQRSYTPMHTPFFMKKSVMAETCQLSDFDDQLYKVSTGKDSEMGEDNESYLIATSEQPISAYFLNEVIERSELPIRFAGFSTCFRKEAGAHGKDTWGVFRVHQFEKIEQFVITSPEDSWAEHEKMITVSEEFYQSLGLPYRIVNIVSGALNDAAAKKYDLEAWFPGYNTYRELVSCSNCTDFQSRGLNIRMSTKKGEKDGKNGPEYVHMLNSTLTATERTLCCILENYQTEKGVVVPKVLIPYVGVDFIPYITTDVFKTE